MFKIVSDYITRLFLHFIMYTPPLLRYCDCFANGEFCRDSCNCQNCKNSFQHEEDRSRAVKVRVCIIIKLSIIGCS